MPSVARVVHAGSERRIAKLFARLASSEDRLELAEAEDLIWALWCLHPDAEAERDMQRLIGLLARSELDAARDLADSLVSDYPDWAEAWNKRATLAYIEHRDDDAVADIARTIALEPRHFGALCGLGQIAERQGHELQAQLAYEQALVRNPNLDMIRTQAEKLRARNPRVLH